MSLLRHILKKRVDENKITRNEPTHNPGVLPSIGKRPNYAKSISTASVKSVTASLLSFTSVFSVGGSKIPKRRRPPKSTLGKPIFFSKKSDAPAVDVHLPGIIELVSGNANRVTHSKTLNGKDGAPRLSLLLHNQANPLSGAPIYNGEAVISGEVRLKLSKPEAIQGINVWVGGRMYSRLEAAEPYFLKMHANLWSRQSGDPASPSSDMVSKKGKFEGKFAPGLYVFPFEFAALPADVPVSQQENTVKNGRGEARVPLPPTYMVTGHFWEAFVNYSVGLDIELKGSKVEERIEHEFLYRPRSRLVVPHPSPHSPFPLLPTRDDWPHEMEEIGGWTLSPFGGRGRWRVGDMDEMIEVEGILGIPCPSVFTPNSTISVTLLLWSTNADAAAALATPQSVQLRFKRTDIRGPDALSPTSRTRANRVTGMKGPIENVRGRMWREGASREEALATAESPLDDETPPAPIPTNARASSPVPSLEDLDKSSFPGEDASRIVRMDGEVSATIVASPLSFRYKYMAREYIVEVAIKHRSYVHISPNADTIVGEIPVWLVTDPPRSPLAVTTTLPFKTVGTIVPLEEGEHVHMAAVSKGGVTEEMRPIWNNTRLT